ncbi:MAG: acyl-CoA synthetase [Melioribacteraceae bacterium]|nr:MAG: acyl-CoA synthetase [Melioribacteraceae bacterium]
MEQAIKNFFYPKSICVAGASTKEKSIGYELLKTISTYGYRGVLYPVNPKADSVLGYKCYKSIEDISDPIDLAIIVVPKPFVEGTVDSLLTKGVKSIVLITAGFKETGKEGEELEARIVQKIKDSDARMVGPNCMGVISTLPDIKLNATFVAERPETGSTGFLSQSGALGAAVLNSLRETDIKFAHFISVGNKADISENSLLDFWQEDDNIKTFTFYLESFVDGEGFVKKYMSGEITKPSIVLKAGKTASGMKAASSHTGALSSRDNVVSALLKQFGILRVNDLNELFNTAKGFENFPIPKGNRIGVITNAGGPAILAVDSLDKEGLELAEFSEETKIKLREVVHPEGSVENPVDLLPGGNAEAYKRVNEIVAEDKNVDSIISIFVEPVMVHPFDVVESVYDVKTEKPILQVDMPLPEFWENYRRNSKKHLPLFRNPEDPAAVISNMLFHSAGRAKLDRNNSCYSEVLKLKAKQQTWKPGFLTQQEVNQLASGYNLPVIKNLIVKPENLDNVGDEYFPLVIKGLNSKVIHKSELDAVKLNIKNFDELIKAAAEITSSFNRFKFEVEEYLIQPFIDGRHEVLIGGFRDPSFGPVIMFGTGGKYVEVVCDTEVRSAYLCDEDVDEMIDSTVIGKILAGVRGEASADMVRIREIIKSSARMLIENPSITEFDFNPLIIDSKNDIHAVDIRIKVG